MNIDEIIKQFKDIINNYLDYDNPEDNYEITSEDNKSQRYTDITIFFEKGVISTNAVMNNLAGNIEDIAIKYDPSAYLDRIEKDEYLIRIYWQKDSQLDISDEDLRRFGKSVIGSIKKESPKIRSIHLKAITYIKSARKIKITISCDGIKYSASVYLDDEIDSLSYLNNTCMIKLKNILLSKIKGNI